MLVSYILPLYLLQNIVDLISRLSDRQKTAFQHPNLVCDMNQELINQIINQLETLSLESMRLTKELKALQDTTGTTTKKEEKNPIKNPIQVIFTKDNPYNIGDGVVITNRYQGQKGISGVVTHVSKKQVKFTSPYGQEYSRAFKNVRPSN